MTADPHAGQPVLEAGLPLGEAPTVAIMVHGRGAGPEDILGLVPRLQVPNVSYLAPSAANRTWYPHSFMSPIESNEPYLSSALGVIASLLARIEAAGIPRDRVVLLGFSQGACLAAEFAVRNATRLGGVVVFSGGLIGPPGTRWELGGGFDATPVFQGCSDVDAHIPEARVLESVDVFSRMGAFVTTRLYTGMGHLINDDEIEFARGLLDSVS